MESKFSLGRKYQPDLASVRAYQKSAEDPQESEGVTSQPPRICLGLFAGADALGAGFVHGAPAHLYIEKPHQEAVESLGLVPAEAANRVDVFLRIPQPEKQCFAQQ
jgi:hypothetical protein